MWFNIHFILLSKITQMKLRIKELCKEKGITMKDIAVKLHINPVNLSASLNGNPTLSRLVEVADILGVTVSELFVQEAAIIGYVEVQGRIYKICSKSDLVKLVKAIPD